MTFIVREVKADRLGHQSVCSSKPSSLLYAWAGLYGISQCSKTSFDVSQRMVERPSRAWERMSGKKRDEIKVVAQ